MRKQRSDQGFESQQAGRAAGSRWFPVMGGALALVGAVVSTMSTLDHARFRASGSAAGSLCGMLSETGCTAAHASAAAELLGFPISLWGFAYYLAVLTLAVAGAAALRQAPRGARSAFVHVLTASPTVLGLAAVASVGYSAWLGSLLLRAGEWCPLCVALYAVNAGLLATVALWRSRVPERPRVAHVAGGLAVLGLVTAAVFAPAALAYRGLAGDAVAAQRAEASPRPVPASARPPEALPDRLPRRGSADAGVTLVEFSDFACPYCATMHETIDTFLDGPDAARTAVRFVNFPLDASCNPHVRVNLHPTACLAARAGICAEQEGAFWPFARALFANRDRQSEADLLRYAREAGLDEARFTACLAAPATAAALAEDIEIARGLGVVATPTLIAGGIRYEGAMPAEQLRQLAGSAPPCACDPTALTCACDHAQRVGCACRAAGDPTADRAAPVFGEGSCQ